MPRLDRTVGMRNKVETRLKKCKKGGKTRKKGRKGKGSRRSKK